VEELWEMRMMTNVKLRLIETDFKKRICASLGEEISTGTEGVQVIPIPMNDSRFQTTTKKEHFLSTKTSMGIDFLLLGKAATKLRYIPEMYFLAAMSMSHALVPLFVEASTVLSIPTPNAIQVRKKGIQGDGPVADLLTADQRLNVVLSFVKEKQDSHVSYGNHQIRLNYGMDFIGIINPWGSKTLVSIRSLPGFSYGIENLAGIASVFNYGIQRPTIEVLGRLALYVLHLAYTGEPGEPVDSTLLIDRILPSVGVLQEVG
jgi:hypothetical protein